MSRNQTSRKASYSGGTKRRHDEFHKRTNDARTAEEEAERPIEPMIEIDPDARVKHVRIREPRR